MQDSVPCLRWCALATECYHAYGKQRTEPHQYLKIPKMHRCGIQTHISDWWWWMLVVINTNPMCIVYVLFWNIFNRAKEIVKFKFWSENIRVCARSRHMEQNIPPTNFDRRLVCSCVCVSARAHTQLSVCNRTREIPIEISFFAICRVERHMFYVRSLPNRFMILRWAVSIERNIHLYVDYNK